jgi:FMN reductase
MKPASPTIVIVSASQAEKSRSRMAALHAHAYLTTRDVKVDWLNLQDHNVLTYPRSKADPELETLIERFNTADGWVLAAPVYNWAVSGVLMNFLHYALDDDPHHRLRPFVIVGGAGGVKSHLALDGLARTMVYEISAIQVGPPLLAAGNLADRATGVLEPDLQQRIEQLMEALVHFAVAAREFRLKKKRL